MNRIILTICFTLALCVCAVAQQPAPKAIQQPADVISTTPAQQKAFAEAQEKAQRAYKGWNAASERADALPADATMKERLEALFDIAEARRLHDVAAAEVRATVFYIMAQLKISPDEYDPGVEGGGLVFKRKG